MLKQGQEECRQGGAHSGGSFATSSLQIEVRSGHRFYRSRGASQVWSARGWVRAARAHGRSLSEVGMLSCVFRSRRAGC